jgi:peptidoglycan/xylan/chitin deacetylase (PgdA/CDA1 family)
MIAIAAAVLIHHTAVSRAAEEKQVPVLLFHHLAESADDSMIVTPHYFEEVIKSLADAGYTAIGTTDLIAYVDGEGTLPEKPLMITFDDGYESNITLAAPILEKYGMRAVIYTIGVSVGKDTYKDTEKNITPHFSWEQAQQFSQIIEIQSHSYDMHQVSTLDGSDCRQGVLQMEGESVDDYAKAFKADILRASLDIEDHLKTPVTSFAYPYGQYNELTEEWLREIGVRITMSTEKKVNKIQRGDDSSLLLLGRFTITEGDDVIELIEAQ